ncbi:hypothetical protein AVEN_3917-1 [Araneus ventricosus]|uniref:Uncharacterized protein n=1 Tax=Araneus ventricosus TaxID=182803 RepID=A0A4Y2IGI4_ARAVE|nr:hypothetical protein AVEN_3917-1 [Araneus ventricosus]
MVNGSIFLEEVASPAHRGKGLAMAGHTGSPSSKRLLRCEQTVCTTVVFSGETPHVHTLRRVHCQNPTFFGSKKKYLKTSSSSKKLFQNLVLISSVKHSPSYTKIRCRAKLFLHRSLPEPKVKLFSLHGIETKLNLLCQDAKLSSETRQTVQKPLVSTQRPVASQLGGKDSILIGIRGFSEKGSVLP